MVHVIDLESRFQPSMIGDKYKLLSSLTNGLDRGDILTIHHTSKLGGIEFHSENLNREFYLCDSVLLEKVK